MEAIIHARYEAYTGPKEESLPPSFYKSLVKKVRAKYLELGMNVLPEEKNKLQMMYLIRKIRGIIKPQCTNRGLKRREIGSDTGNHPSQLKIANGKNEIKVQKREYEERKKVKVRAKHFVELQKSKYTNEKRLHLSGAKEKADSIVQFNISEFSNSIINALDSLDLGKLVRSFYIMYTGGIATIDGTEWAGFLSNRTTRSGPVLRHTVESPFYRTGAQDESIITLSQMRDSLGFKVMRLYTSSLQINARDVEDAALQKKFQFLPLGCRLWRCIDNGRKYQLPDGTDKVHSVSIVYSDEIIPMINKGLIRVCETIH